MTVALLGAILETAVERRVIVSDPTRSRRLRLRLPVRESRRSHLESAAQIEALLNGASELDREAAPNARHIELASLAARTERGED